MCPQTPVDDVWVDSPKGGGYWLPVCRAHLDEINGKEG